MQMKCVRWNATDYCLVDKFCWHLLYFKYHFGIIAYIICGSLNSPSSQLYHLSN